MSLDILVSVIGTVVTVLSVLLTLRSMFNGTRETIRRIEDGQRAMHKDLVTAIERLGELIVADGERTRDLVRTLRESPPHS
jgi:hypothetical protein